MALPSRWRVAEAIKQLQRQVRPLAPAAPAVAFGTVADTLHGEGSQHFPKVYPGLGSTPVVCAGDFPKAGRLNPRAVLDAIRRSRDDRVLYGISEGQMFSSYPTSAHPAWTWRPYGGADGHFDHGHLSVVGDARADNPRPWQIALTPVGADMDPNASNIIAGIPNWQVFADLWQWGATGRFGDLTARTGDRFRTGTWPAAVDAKFSAVRADLAAVKATLGALLETGGDPDSAAVIARMDAIAAADRGRDEAHAAALAVVQAENAALRDELARTREAAEANLSETERDALDSSL